MSISNTRGGPQFLSQVHFLTEKVPTNQLDENNFIGVVRDKDQFLQIVQDKFLNASSKEGLVWIGVPNRGESDIEVDVISLKELQAAANKTGAKDTAEKMWELYNQVLPPVEESAKSEVTADPTVVHGKTRILTYTGGDNRRTTTTREILTVNIAGNDYLFDVTDCDFKIAEGGMKKLLLPYASSGESTPYLVGLLKVPSEATLSTIENGQQILERLSAKGLKHLDEPCRLIKVEVSRAQRVPRGQPPIVKVETLNLLLVKRWNQGNLQSFSTSKGFESMNPEDQVQILKDIIEGQNGLAQVIGTDFKSDNILVHYSEETKKFEIYFSDLDGAILPPDGRFIDLDPEDLEKFMKLLINFKMEPAHTPVFTPRNELRDLQRKVGDLYKVLQEIQNSKSEDLETKAQNLLAEIQELSRAIQAFQLGVCLYETYMNAIPYESTKANQYYPNLDFDIKEQQRSLLENKLAERGIKGERGKQIANVIVCLLDRQPNKRMTVAEAHQIID